jgi:hypothetical protein
VENRTYSQYAVYEVQEIGNVFLYISIMYFLVFSQCRLFRGTLDYLVQNCYSITMLSEESVCDDEGARRWILDPGLTPGLGVLTYYMSLQYRNKSKSQLTGPAASCCVISGTHSMLFWVIKLVVFFWLLMLFDQGDRWR